MGILNPFAKEPKLTSQMTVGITEVGKKTAEQELARGPTFAILSALNEHSPRSIGDLSEEIQVEISEVKERIKILARQGYLRITGMQM